MRGFNKIHPNTLYESSLISLKALILHKKSKEQNKLFTKYCNLIYEQLYQRSKDKDLFIQFMVYVKDSLISLHIHGKQSCLCTFDLNEPFNSQLVMDAIRYNAFLFTDQHIKIEVCDLDKLQFLFLDLDASNLMKQIITCLYNDIVVWGVDRVINIKLNYDDANITLSVDHAYPFMENADTFHFKFPTNSKNILEVFVHQLNFYTDRNVSNESIKSIVPIEEGQHFVETLNILDRILYLNSSITDAYLESPDFTGCKKVSCINMDFKSINQTNIQLGMYISDIIEIQVSSFNIAFLFGDIRERSENFTWLRTHDIENDIAILKQLFIIYLGKVVGYPITDLAREMQLLEMQLYQ